MDTLNYLAYGSNLLRARLAARIPIVATAGTFEWRDWALVWNKRGKDGSAKCNVLPQAGARVWVAVYVIPARAKATLDEIEGAGHGYRVDTLETCLFGTCFFYRAEPAAAAADLMPFDWYQELVVAGARAHGFPADYVRELLAVRTQTDTDQARLAQHRALMRE